MEGKRLTKRVRDHNPPPVAYLNHKPGSSTLLKRSTSDAGSSYSHSNQLGLGGRQPAAPSYSTTTTGPPASLRRSPSLLTPVNEQTAANSHVDYQQASASSSSFAHLPPASFSPFNAAVVEQALHAQAKPAGRPGLLQHSYTDQPKHSSPRLRQSTSFTTLARKMDTPPSGTKSPRSNRYSDEGDAAKKRNSGGGKKKGTFSSFMSNLVSSPRRPTISTPTNPMHVTHVSIDNETGEFTVCGPLTGGQAAAPLHSTRMRCSLSLSSLYPSIAPSIRFSR